MIHVTLSSRRLKRRGRKFVYYARWHNEHGEARSKKLGTDKALCWAAAKDLERELNAGEYVAAESVTWAVFAEHHCKSIAHPATRRKAKSILEDARVRGGFKFTSDVTFARLERYVWSMRDDGLAASTIGNHMRYLRAALRAGKQRGQVAKVPEFKRLFPVVEERLPRALSAEETVRLVDAAAALNTRWGALVQMALDTGARKSEMTKLRWDAVHLGIDPHATFIRTKTHLDRRIPLSDAVVAALIPLQAATQLEGGPFIRLEGNFQYDWLKIIRAADLPGVQFRHLRSTAATRWASSGVAVQDAQRLLGHRDLKTTMKHYVRVQDADLRRAVNSASHARFMHTPSQKSATGTGA